MLRVTKLTDYATVVMTCLPESGEAVRSAQEVAERSRLEPPTVGKLLKQLARAGLIESCRGAHGGYRLARPAADISVADIVAAIEGPFGMTECSAHQGQCGYESHCGVRSNWRRISLAIETALKSVSLAEMAAPRAPRKTIPVRMLGAEA